MIFDVLTSQAGVGELSFVAASAPPNSVAVAGAGVNGVTLASSDIPAKTWFEPGDNLKINFIQVSIPYGFGAGIGQTSLRFIFRNNVPLGFLIPEFSSNGWITYPNLCDKLEFPGDGLFVAAPKNQGRFQFKLVDFISQVSMVNLPTSLVGVTVQLFVHVGVTHTLPMASVP